MNMVKNAGPSCPNKCRTTSRNRLVKMHRIYKKEGNRQIGIGWICPTCNKIIHNDEVEKDE